MQFKLYKHAIRIPCLYNFHFTGKKFEVLGGVFVMNCISGIYKKGFLCFFIEYFV